VRSLNILVRVLAAIAIVVGGLVPEVYGPPQRVGSLEWHAHSSSAALILTHDGGRFDAAGRAAHPPGLPSHRRVLAAARLAGAVVVQSSAALHSPSLTPFLVRGPPLSI
jgi:hypothetical protein